MISVIVLLLYAAYLKRCVLTDPDVITNDELRRFIKFCYWITIVYSFVAIYGWVGAHLRV